MEPGHEDREYPQDGPPIPRCVLASMEPGHEDREYLASSGAGRIIRKPQWSPVMKTGNTRVVAVIDLSEYGLNGARS